MFFASDSFLMTDNRYNLAAVCWRTPIKIQTCRMTHMICLLLALVHSTLMGCDNLEDIHESWPARCPNGICEKDEDCASCQEDCGICDDLQSTCSDGECQDDENCSNCEADCGPCEEDLCPNDPNKTKPGICGCGKSEVDNNNNGMCDSEEETEDCDEVTDGVSNPDLTAFPGAEGFGRFSSGGRGGDVYHVTNLNDSGAGSLRMGIESAMGPRTIVFGLSGTIRLESKLTISKPNITIAGQTAPGDGIALRDRGLFIKADNIIVRYLRSRLGDIGGVESDSISIEEGSDIILDHCSASWSIDEVLSNQSLKVDRVTVQWCMITESLHDSIHEKGPHGMGGIIGGLRQSFHHNLYAHHNSRNPKVTWRHHCKVDFRNNVIYNWGSNSVYDGSVSHMNWVNNYYKSGPATKSNVRNRIFEIKNINDSSDAQNYEATLYAQDNYVHRFPNITEDNWSAGIDFDSGTSEEKNRALKPFDFPSITEQSAEEAYSLVLSDAGSSLLRDAVDERIIEEVRKGISTFGNDGIIDSQEDVGGWPKLKSSPAPQDTDRDGMPDQWENEKHLDPTTPDNNCTSLSAEGYTNLEMYMNSLVAR